MEYIKIEINNETTPACSVLLIDAQFSRRGRIIPEVRERGKELRKTKGYLKINRFIWPLSVITLK